MMPGSSEWLIILAVALLIFGPSKLPQLGGAIGAGIRNFKRAIDPPPSDKKKLPAASADETATASES